MISINRLLPFAVLLIAVSTTAAAQQPGSSQPAEDFGFGTVVVSPDDRTLASLDNSDIRLWDLASGKELRKLKGQASYKYVYAIAFTPDSRRLLSVSERTTEDKTNPDQTLREWDVASGKELRIAKVHGYEVDHVTFSADAKLIAMTSQLGTESIQVRVWDVASTTEVWVKVTYFGENAEVQFNLDKNIVASGGEWITLWEASTGKEIRTLDRDQSLIWSLAFSPNGKLLAGVSGNRSIRLWDVATGQELRTFRGHTDLSFSLAFSPDGNILASGSEDKTIKLWDVATGKELRTLRGHTDRVRSVTFTHDGRTLISCSKDGTIKFWRVSDGREMRTLRRSSLTL